jgi:hypothetical protein
MLVATGFLIEEVSITDLSENFCSRQPDMHATSAKMFISKEAFIMNAPQTEKCWLY